MLNETILLILRMNETVLLRAGLINLLPQNRSLPIHFAETKVVS